MLVMTPNGAADQPHGPEEAQLPAGHDGFTRLMDRREAPGRKRMGIRSPVGAARYPISSPPAPFLLCHLLFPPTTFVRFASATSLAQIVFELLKGVPVQTMNYCVPLTP